MLQRAQSLWLLLAAIIGLLTFRFSFFSGNRISGQTRSFEYVTASSGMILVVLTVALICITGISVFLYKNRKLQLRLVLISLVISLLNIYLYFRETQRFVEGNYDLTAILPIALPIILFFAARGIYRDQKLVKSLDRLR
jgi:dipeptide/tripeptide permease